MSIKRRISRLLFRPDAHTAAVERDAWRVLIVEVRKVQSKLSIEIEDEGFETMLRRVIDSGSPIEHVAVLDELLGEAGDAHQIGAAEIQDIDADGTPGELFAAWEQRAKQLFRAVLREGPTAGHVHAANGHTALP